MVGLRWRGVPGGGYSDCYQFAASALFATGIQRAGEQRLPLRHTGDPRPDFHRLGDWRGAQIGNLEGGGRIEHGWLRRHRAPFRTVRGCHGSTDTMAVHEHSDDAAVEDVLRAGCVIGLWLPRADRFIAVA